MVLDSVVIDFLSEIQKELIEENKVELSIQEIGEIVDSQFVAANYAFKKGVEVRLPGFGSFIRKNGKQKIEDTLELKAKRAELGEEEFEKQLYALRVRNKIASKERPDKLTLEELRGVPDIVKIKSKYDL